jgi:arylformamidase
MHKVIDISVPLHPGLPLWPGSSALEIVRDLDLDKGDEANVSRLTLDVHSGTHLDAPLHFIPDGKSTEEISLDKCIGPCQVIDCRGIDLIDAHFLERAHIPAGTSRILLKTDYWTDFSQPFREDFTALSLDGAQWVADRGVVLVGIDCHSIQSYADSYETHRVLLRKDIVIVESLYLRDVAAGSYELICLPLRVKGLEAVPVRAILRSL